MKWVILDGRTTVQIGCCEEQTVLPAFIRWPIKINKNWVPLPYTGKSLAEAIVRLLNGETLAKAKETGKVQPSDRVVESIYQKVCESFGAENGFDSFTSERVSRAIVLALTEHPIDQEIKELNEECDEWETKVNNLNISIEHYRKLLINRDEAVRDAKSALAVQTAIANNLRAELEGLEEKKEPNAKLLTALKFMVGAFNADPIDPLVAFICIERANKVIEDCEKKKE